MHKAGFYMLASLSSYLQAWMCMHATIHTLPPGQLTLTLSLLALIPHRWHLHFRIHRRRFLLPIDAPNDDCPSRPSSNG